MASKNDFQPDKNEAETCTVAANSYTYRNRSGTAVAVAYAVIVVGQKTLLMVKRSIRWYYSERKGGKRSVPRGRAR